MGPAATSTFDPVRSPRVTDPGSATDLIDCLNFMGMQSSVEKVMNGNDGLSKLYIKSIYVISFYFVFFTGHVKSKHFRNAVEERAKKVKVRVIIDKVNGHVRSG